MLQRLVSSQQPLDMLCFKALQATGDTEVTSVSILSSNAVQGDQQARLSKSF